MSEKTEAAVLFETNKPLEVISLSIPNLKPGQVLVDVAYSGICHTQLLEVQGKRGMDRFLPHTLGHEGSGVVSQTGAGVKKVRPGDRVVLSWIKGSGIDVSSAVYESVRGAINSGSISTFMRRAVTCENRVTRIPDQMPLREAALLGCAIPTGAGIVRHAAKVEPGSRVAVFGVGGVGLSAVLAAVMAQASVVLAVDQVEAKLEKARQLGATHTVNTRSQDVLTAVREMTHGEGLDYAIECAGKRQLMETAFQVVRAGGGVCVLAGNLPFGEKISLDPFDLIKGKRITGTWGGETDPDQDIPFYADLYITKKLRLSELITHEYQLGEINTALRALEDGVVGRSLVRL